MIRKLVSETVGLLKEFHSINEGDATLTIDDDIYVIDDAYARRIIKWHSSQGQGAKKIKKWPKNLNDVADESLKSNLKTLESVMKDFPKAMQDDLKRIMLPHISDIMKKRSEPMTDAGRLAGEWQTKLMQVHSGDRGDAVGKGEAFLVIRFGDVTKPTGSNIKHYDLTGADGKKISVKYAEPFTEIAKETDSETGEEKSIEKMIPGSFKLNDLRKKITEKITAELVGSYMEEVAASKEKEKMLKDLASELGSFISTGNVSTESFGKFRRILLDILEKNKIENNGDKVVKLIAKSIPNILSDALNQCIDIDKFVVCNAEGWDTIKKVGGSFNLRVHQFTQDKIAAGLKNAGISSPEAVYRAMENEERYEKFSDEDKKFEIMKIITSEDQKFDGETNIFDLLRSAKKDKKEINDNIASYNTSQSIEDLRINIEDNTSNKKIAKKIAEVRGLYQRSLKFPDTIRQMTVSQIITSNHHSLSKESDIIDLLKVSGKTIEKIAEEVEEYNKSSSDKKLKIKKEAKKEKLLKNIASAWNTWKKAHSNAAVNEANELLRGLFSF